MKPFLKWAGGKTQLLPELAARVPNFSGRYFEPFVGGGALFFHLVESLPGREWILGDANAALIRTYHALGQWPSSVIDCLHSYAKAHSEKFYYTLRAETPDPFCGSSFAARFIYLNKTCFNGLYRENRTGKFNVPFGKKATFVVEEDVLRTCSEALQKCRFRDDGFDQFPNDEPKKGDFVYFDPPYAPLSATSSFTSYVKSGFDARDQERLRDYALACKRRGAHVLLSNSSAPLIRELYKGPEWKVEEVSARRNINSKASARGAVTELLIS